MGTINSVKSSMRYTAARDRTDSCAGCKHFEATYPDRMPPYDKPSFKCRKGGFYTSQMAVCEEHELRADRCD